MFSFTACRGCSPKASAKLRPFSSATKFLEMFNTFLTLCREHCGRPVCFIRLGTTNLGHFTQIAKYFCIRAASKPRLKKLICQPEKYSLLLHENQILHHEKNIPIIID